MAEYSGMSSRNILKHAILEKTIPSGIESVVSSTLIQTIPTDVLKIVQFFPRARLKGGFLWI
jgi:hypothetical protein